ncbi:hypothetical protein CCP2SC5_420004 [Azospirillaceae bacterium]
MYFIQFLSFPPTTQQNNLPYIPITFKFLLQKTPTPDLDDSAPEGKIMKNYSMQ